MISFFDLSKTELTPFIDRLWASSSMNVSLYIRGSSIQPQGSNFGKPIDIDLLLFTHSDKDIIREKAIDISNDAYKASPSAPRLDIKIINCLDESPELLFNTLVASKTGRLLHGRDLHTSDTSFKKHKYKIIVFALREAESKLKSVILTSNKEIQNKRIPHLSKAITRIAGLLMLNEGIYTRSPEDCAKILCERYPTIIDNVAIILHSFRNNFLSEELLLSYLIVLNEIKQDIESE